MDTDQSTFLWAEPRASPSLSPACEGDWPTPAATWPSFIWDWLTCCAPAGWCGRTSPACSPAGVVSQKVRRRIVWEWDTESGTWRKLSTSKQTISDVSLPPLQNSGMGGPTESWTLSTSEFNHTLGPSRSDGGVCSLLDILETGDLPPRYFLSAKACAGILRRAERRGKALPPMLHRALCRVAGV